MHCGHDLCALVATASLAFEYVDTWHGSTVPTTTDQQSQSTEAKVGCRKYVIKALASQLRPELEAVVKKNTLAPGEAYSPAAEQVLPLPLVCKRLGSCLVSTVDWAVAARVQYGQLLGDAGL